MRRGLLYLLALALLPGTASAQSVGRGGITMFMPGGGGAPVYNVRSYGATGDGTTDDTVAIQAALTACGATSMGGTVYLPAATYKVASVSGTEGGIDYALRIPEACAFVGEATGYNVAPKGTVIDARTFTGATNIHVLKVAGDNVLISDLWVRMDLAGITSSGTYDTGVQGIKVAAAKTKIYRVSVSGGREGINIRDRQTIAITDSYVVNVKNRGLVIHGTSHEIEVTGTLVSNCGVSTGPEDGGLVIGNYGAIYTSEPFGVRFVSSLVDEGAGASIRIHAGHDIYIEGTVIYYSKTNANGVGPGYGIKIGHGAGASANGPQRVTVANTRIEPFSGSGTADATIYIDLAARDVRLFNINTSAAGGTDIVDNAPDTQYINVNGATRYFEMQTADAVIPHGSVVMPDAGTDSRFDILTGSGTLAIGVVQGNGDTAQGTTYPVVTTGRAYVRMQEDAAATRGHWAIVSATAGLVNDSATVTTIGLNVGKFLRSEAVSATINPTGCTGGSGCINTALNTPSVGPAGQITLGVDVAALGWAIGDAVQYWNSGGATPTGLTDGQTYFLASVSTTKVTLTATKGSSTIVVPSTQGNDGTQYLIRLPLVAVSLQ